MKNELAPQNQLWLLPGIIIVSLQWIIRYILPAVIPEVMIIGVFAGLAGGVAVAIWWLFFSHAGKPERWGAIVLIVASLYGTSFLLDDSIATANMGLMFIMYSIPLISLAFVLWAVFSRKLNTFTRRFTMVVTILFASGIWIFLRTNGMTGEGHHDIGWRWTKTNEDLLLEQIDINSPFFPSEIVTKDIVPEWPGFRGPGRNGIVYGVTIKTNWSENPPDEMWQRPIGPGCSSVAVHNNLIYTQEQRGEYETVTCYRLTDGEHIWTHSDKARFYDSHAGPGPRSTPTFAGEHIYTLGATGILNALEAIDGSVKWTRNAASDMGVEAPNWGFSASPLVVGDVVIIALESKLAAFDITSGVPKWFGEEGGSGYSSPQFMIIDSIPQVLLMSEAGVISVEPGSGKKLWDYIWPLEGRVLQPALIENNDLVITEEYKNIRRISLSRKGETWNTKEIWTSHDMKAVFNDMVVHKGYIYGFDGPYLTCVDLRDGKRKWRGGRYQGFTLLLADQDLILVLTEKGDIALVSANSEKFTELGRFHALNGKTWNVPALAGNILIVRNAEEMAAYRLN